MNGWNWLTQPPQTWRFIGRVLAKAALLFLVINLLFALLNPLDALGRLSLYNWLVPGRVRLPYGEVPQAYNLSLDNLNAMFAAHEIAQAKADDEFRVVFIGDSSTWGVLLRPEQTLTGHISAQRLTLADGRRISAYNLGHPVLSLSKDLLLLNHALEYDPDMIVWLTTLRSFPHQQQFEAPLVQRNFDEMRRLLAVYAPDYPLPDAPPAAPSLLERTLVGQRRALADWLRLQLYGVMWAATGIDQFYPPEYAPVTSDFEEDISWRAMTAPTDLTEDVLAFDLIRAGHQMAGGIPLLLVNEPIFISQGANSQLRYNLWYPRWAYDSYRQLYAALAQEHGWNYLDLWNMIDAAEFTDSPVHLTPEGSQQLAQRLADEILRVANSGEADSG